MGPDGTRNRLSRTLSLVAAGACAAVALTACAASGGSSGGDTAYFAEQALAAPNYIFPFSSSSYFYVSNLAQFQQLMYRPLYWFGKGATPNLNLDLSLANAPVYTNGNRVVTITMKPYKWSNGESVTAQDVSFWLNMMAAEKSNWGGYVPGTIPDDIKSVAAKGSTLTITLTGPVNTDWFTYNELSQLTPMPMAWDVSADGQKTGSEACATASFASVTTSTDEAGAVTPVSPAAQSCAAVYTYLDGQSRQISTYAVSPVWSVVDGPWKLEQMDADGNVTMVPNTAYSGPVKPTIAKFVELPFTSADAEFNALTANKVDLGYLPSQDTTSNATTGSGDPCDLTPGANNPRLSSYDLVSVFPWAINYFPLNFTSTANNGQEGKLFSQLYFRQAFQMLVNQPLYIKRIDKGYGVPTYGPVPICVTNSFATTPKTNNPYAYNPAGAIALLRSHGWTIKPSGTSTCSDASKCGVAAGTPLAVDLQYVSGYEAITQLMNAEKSSWTNAGIDVNLTSAAFSVVAGGAEQCSGPSCTWQMQNWGAGWAFAPDYFPVGDILFQTRAGENFGSYSDQQADTLIKATYQRKAGLTAYGNYLAQQLPVVWQPNPISVYEVNKRLTGVTPINPVLTINPENWRFVP